MREFCRVPIFKNIYILTQLTWFEGFKWIFVILGVGSFSVCGWCWTVSHVCLSSCRFRFVLVLLDKTVARDVLAALIPCCVLPCSFRSFDVEESGGCRGDWLLLGPTWKDEYRVCGSALPPPFISSRGAVWLHFHSQANSSGLAQGFRLSYIRSEWMFWMSSWDWI